MSTVNYETLLSNFDAVLKTLQNEDVAIVRDGTVIAVLTRPATQRPATYWQQREAALASIPDLGTWDSTVVISEDRDRS